MGLVQRVRHGLGDVIRMDEQNAVLMTYFRNNVLHLLAIPSLIACCFLNNREMRTEDIQRLMWRVYPYVRDELFLRWDETEMSSVVVESLKVLAHHGLIESPDKGSRGVDQRREVSRQCSFRYSHT